VLWLTGLSGAGKSTIAQALRASLGNDGRSAIVLDSDVLRTGLCADLGFSTGDRNENIRRVAHVAKLFQDQGHTVITATISPLASHRALARSIIGPGFVEVFVSTSLQECIRRDPKGLYRLARRGAVAGFTGIGSVYERPLEPDFTVDTSGLAIADTVAMIRPWLDAALTHGQRLVAQNDAAA
jgi:adenylylsulfate kinase